MKKCSAIFTLVILFALLLSCGPAPLTAQEPVKVGENAKKAAQSVNEFAIDLYGKLKGKKGNLFLSPASIETALAMTYAGARGETAAEMKKVLHFTLDDKELHPAMGKLTKLLSQKQKGCSVSIANALWGQKGYSFLKEFLDLNKQNYGAGLQQVDFENATEQARKTINQWVEDKTNDKIKELIRPGILDKLTTLVLTNAIHFKGAWKKPFNKSDTKKRQFFVTKDKSVEVDMMRMTEQKFKYLSTKDFQVVELPYAGENISMVIFLPHKLNGLAEFEKKLSAENLKKWLSQMSKQKIDYLAIPRFKMTCELRLKETLKKMGMESAFDPSRADFSGMSSAKENWIDAVIHKAFVQVNEEGTEAAAATAVKMKRNGGGITFSASHPFFFVIQDTKSGAILFLGRLVDPKP